MEDELDDESAYHLLGSRMAIEDCWEGIIERIDAVERAEARERYRRQKRLERRDVGMLPSDDIQRLLAQRLKASRASRP